MFSISFALMFSRLSAADLLYVGKGKHTMVSEELHPTDSVTFCLLIHMATHHNLSPFTGLNGEFRIKIRESECPLKLQMSPLISLRPLCCEYSSQSC